MKLPKIKKIYGIIGACLATSLSVISVLLISIPATTIKTPIILEKTADLATSTETPRPPEQLVVVADSGTGSPALIPASAADAVIAATADHQEPIEKELVIKISHGDTLMSLLMRIGIGKDHAFKAIESIKTVFDPRALKIGQEISIRYRRAVDEQSAAIMAITFKSQTGNEICLKNDQGEFFAKKFDIELTKVLRRTEGTINTSFYSAAVKRGVPATIVKEAISALSYDINWQHDPKSGDKYTIVYEVYEDKDGRVIKNGELKFAAFAPGGTERRIYRYQPTRGGNAGYYNSRGESVVKSLLQTPMDPTKMRVTSKFGTRRHPIQGYSKMHKGVDFGAPVGTPVMSAGDGVVMKAGWFGAYGNYVLVKHNAEYSTAYAHLSKVHVKVGDRVRQRQVVGAVGTTGRSTGPHLHYEVICRGQHVNPQGIKQLPSVKLSGKDLAHFIKTTETFNQASQKPQEYTAKNMPVAG